MLHRQLLRIACINTGHERIDRVLEKLISEASSDEFRHRFRLRGFSHKRLSQEPHLSTRREERRSKELTGTEWDRMQRCIPNHEPVSMRRISLDHLRQQTEGLDHLPDLGSRLNRVRSVLEEKPVSTLGANDTADAISRFEKLYVLACEAQLMSGDETGNPTAEHCYPMHRKGRVLEREKRKTHEIL